MDKFMGDKGLSELMTVMTVVFYILQCNAHTHIRMNVKEIGRDRHKTPWFAESIRRITR
jgi:hypothetical protein